MVRPRNIWGGRAPGYALPPVETGSVSTTVSAVIQPPLDIQPSSKVPMVRELRAVLPPGSEQNIYVLMQTYAERGAFGLGVGDSDYYDAL